MSDRVNERTVGRIFAASDAECATVRQRRCKARHRRASVAAEYKGLPLSSLSTVHLRALQELTTAENGPEDIMDHEEIESDEDTAVPTVKNESAPTQVNESGSESDDERESSASSSGRKSWEMSSSEEEVW